MRARSGFTLLELVVVVTLVGALVAIAFPRLDFQGSRLRSSERTLSTTLLAAQQRAVLQQHAVNVVLDTAAARLVVHEDRNNDGVRDAGEAERVWELEEGVVFTRDGVPEGPAGVDIVSFTRSLDGLPVVTFQRSGSLREGGGFYLGTVRSARGERPGDARVVMLERATGRLTRFYLEDGRWRRVHVQ